MTPVGCHEQIAPYGQLMLEGIPIRGLVDTGASVSCLAHSTWWQIGGVVPTSPGHLRCEWQTSAYSRACEALTDGMGTSQGAEPHLW